MKNFWTLIALIVTVVVEIIGFTYIKSHSYKSNNQLIKSFMCILLCMIFWCIGLVIQIFVINFISDNYALYIDYFVYTFSILTPVALFFFAYIFDKEKITFKPRFVLMFVIPIISMAILWTNDYHHLFYESYSTNISLTKFGPFYNYFYAYYSYATLGLDIFILLKSSIRKTSLRSIQTLLILASILVPLSINISAALNIFPVSIYATPISFSVSVLLCGIAIFKYDFLNIAPIALRSIVNQISDGYIVLNINYEISDCNHAFEKIFKINKDDILGKSFDSLDLNDIIVLQKGSIGNYLEKAQSDNKIHQIDAYMHDKSKYFNIEISGLISDYKCVGILILFKDTTQHIKDMEALKNNQDILMERERLATLGQMVGGIAHNLKTPIMSIAGAMEGLQDLVTEYNSSIDDEEVTKEDHHQIANDMMEWINKVNSYDSYMSDVITAVKGQTVNFNDSTTERFEIDELLKRVNILMKHELKSSLMTLNVDCQIDKETTLQGNINSLVQVINNLISNAIQAYGSKQNETIDLTISENNNKIVISVRDYGSGIPEDVQKKLFNKMITTKGHKGTGLGLFMSYSTIKGHFNGDLNFTSKANEGTTFNIVLPKATKSVI